MMAGNPNWWSFMKNGMHPQISPSQFVYPSYNVSDNPSLPSNSSHHQADHGFPIRSWTHLLLQSGVSGDEEEEERFGGTLFQQKKKFENWEDQVLNLNTAPFLSDRDDMKQEIAQSTTNFGDDELSIHANRDSNIWFVNNSSHNHLMPVCSPITTSCITTNLTCNDILNFTGGAKAAPEVAEGKRNREQLLDRSSECDSLGIGVVHSGPKKARVHHFSPQPVLKVRKEKLMDRITALHQLVSPYGKTDTASVLSEATGYIRFLHAKIEALSSPYMRSASGNHHQHSDSQDLGVVVTKELRSRGLCLVPISCTQHVGSGDAADYWASAALGGGF